MARKIHEIRADDQGRKYVNLQPHYCRVFDKAVDQVTKYLPVQEGRALVVEMLEFGKRLNATYHCKECNDESN